MDNPIRPRLFATAPDGTRLPVIDITDPAFAIPTDAQMDTLAADALKEEERRGPLQRFLIGLALKAMARRSRLIAAMQTANSGFMPGLATYVMKLGPTNLVPPYDTEIDRQIERSALVMGMRVRLRQVAELLAEGLAPALAAQPGQPLTILDIAGGPSGDALNALILLAQQALIAGRPIRIAIYDIDTEGPAFAKAMLDALKTGSLSGCDVDVTHVPGSWSDEKHISALLDSIPDTALVAATSEGGLFEYGSDEDIRRCLTALAPRVGLVAGSVTRDDRLNRLMRRHSGAKVVMRGLERFAALVEPIGYRIAASRPNPLSDQVLLTRS
jgi:hypothetical protein